VEEEDEFELSSVLMSMTKAGGLSLEGWEFCRQPMASGFDTDTVSVPTLSGVSLFTTGNDIITRDSCKRTKLGAETLSFGSSFTRELVGADVKKFVPFSSADVIETGCCLKMAASEGEDMALLPEVDVLDILDIGEGGRFEVMGDDVKKLAVVVEGGCC